MKTLVIVGSPKKRGQSMHLVNRLVSKINGEVEIINVFDYMPFKPCLDCGYCTSHKGCSQEDYFVEIYAKLEDADCIVLASPMWFGNISGPLMSFLTRINMLQKGYEVRKDKLHKWDKIGILLMTTGAKWNSMAKTVEATVEFLFNEMDVFMMDSVYANKTDVLPTNMNEQAMQKCDYAAKLITMWYEDKVNNKYCKYGYSSSNKIDIEMNKID